MRFPSDDRTRGGYVPDTRFSYSRVGARQLRTVRTCDLGASETALSRIYLPLRLRPTDRHPALDTALESVDLGAVTIGSVRFGPQIRITTEAAANFHVDFPVSGRSRSAAGTPREVVTSPGSGEVFHPGSPADLTWSKDTRVLCVMLDAVETERRVAAMLGRTIERPLRFEPVLQLGGAAGGVWRHVLRLVDHEMRRESGLLAFSLTRQTLESLVIEALLTGHAHNYSGELTRRQNQAVPRDRIRSAVELLEEHPERPWTTTELAGAVGVGARTLQEQFRGRLDASPMAYLRNVRLDRAHKELSAGDVTTQVSDVARRWGFVHLGRFAADYQRRHGVLPSQTLRVARER
jgi:AraC-like DNA-binding protein